MPKKNGEKTKAEIAKENAALNRYVKQTEQEKHERSLRKLPVRDELQSPYRVRVPKSNVDRWVEKSSSKRENELRERARRHRHETECSEPGCCNQATEFTSEDYRGRCLEHHYWEDCEGGMTLDGYIEREGNQSRQRRESNRTFSQDLKFLFWAIVGVCVWLLIGKLLIR